MQALKKIVIIGPESTGKSTLCELLANHFQTKGVAEYAREYLLTNGKEYTYDNLLTIAKEQLASEDKISSKFPVLGSRFSLFFFLSSNVAEIRERHFFHDKTIRATEERNDEDDGQIAKFIVLFFLLLFLIGWQYHPDPSLDYIPKL